MATDLLTAPCSERVDLLTPSSFCFIALLYVSTPPAKIADAPGTLVMWCPRKPPVHDSATAKVSPAVINRSTTTCAIDWSSMP